MSLFISFILLIAKQIAKLLIKKLYVNILEKNI